MLEVMGMLTGLLAEDARWAWIVLSVQSRDHTGARMPMPGLAAPDPPIGKEECELEEI